MGNPSPAGKKPKILCLHGFRTSAEILKKQVEKWDESVLEKMDLIFIDAPFPAQGPSDVEGIFDPPYYEWFQFNKESKEYSNLDQCFAYIEDCMLKQGPFDGLLGFSRGATLSAALPGLQAKGLVLTKVAKIKFVIIMGGSMFWSPTIAENAYPSPPDCLSLHLIGENDFQRPHGIKLMKSFVDPAVIHHPKGHTVPRLDENGLEIMHKFLENIQNTLATDSAPACLEKG